MKKPTVLAIIYFAVMFLFALWFTSCSAIKKTETVTDSKTLDKAQKVNVSIDTSTNTSKEINITEVEYFKPVKSDSSISSSMVDQFPEVRNKVAQSVKKIKITTILINKNKQGKTIIDSAIVLKEANKIDTVIKSDIKPVNGFNGIIWILVLLIVLALIGLILYGKFSKQIAGFNPIKWIAELFKK